LLDGCDANGKPVARDLYVSDDSGYYSSAKRWSGKISKWLTESLNVGAS
jgi:hypothetical protein